MKIKDSATNISELAKSTYGSSEARLYENNMKPVLFAVDSFFPVLGGAEQQALVLAHTLKGKGVLVEFVAPHLEKELPLQEQIEGFQLTRIPFPRIKFLGAILLMIKFSNYIIRNRRNYSYVHVHITKLLATSLGITKPIHKLRVITKVSGHAEFTGGVLDKSQKFNLTNRIMRHFIKKLDYVQAVSEYTKDVLLDNGFSKEKILQLPNAVDTAKYNSLDIKRVKTASIRFGFCGRVEKVKGLDTLIEAFKNLKIQSELELEVIIAGNGSYINQIKDMARSAGVEECIEFLGSIDDVPGFLNEIDIYIQPSYAEGLSNSVLEAMSAGLPVIASKISGNLDLVEDGVNGMLFEPGNSVALSEKMKEMIATPKRRIEMGENNRKKIEVNYSTNSIGEKLVRLYFGE